jgi:hypothetical protein
VSTLVEDVLGAWREGERLLGRLGPLDPDHDTVSMSVSQMRHLYQQITARGDDTRQMLSLNAATVERTRELLARIEERLAESAT